MSFSDDDLKRLKEIINEHGLITHNMGANVYKALLARLDAAEAFGEMMCLTYGDDAEKTILYEAWRKEAGK